MENATKALYIAAGVLMGVMILSLGMILYSNLQNYVESMHEETRISEVTKFNTQYLNYINYIEGEKIFDLTIQDVITVANLAYENNYELNPTGSRYVSPDNLYVAVYIDRKRIDTNINNLMADLLAANLYTRYKCEAKDVLTSETTGRVYSVNFSVDK